MKKNALILGLLALAACQTTQPKNAATSAGIPYKVSYAYKEFPSEKGLGVRSNTGFSKVYGSNKIAMTLMVEAILRTCPNSFIAPEENHAKKVEVITKISGKEKYEKDVASMVDFFRKNDNANSCGMKY